MTKDEASDEDFIIPKEMGPMVAMTIIQGLAKNLGAVRRDMHVAGLGTRTVDARIDSLLDLSNDLADQIKLEDDTRSEEE